MASPPPSTPLSGGNRRLPWMLREVMESLLLFLAAFWFFGRIDFLDTLTTLSASHPEWNADEVIPALVVALTGFVALVSWRVHVLNKHLRIGADRLRFFFENTPAAVAMFDRRLRFLDTTRRWKTDFGVEAIPLIGQSLETVLPSMPPAWREMPARCLNGLSERCDEYLFHKANGEADWIRWEAHPWYTGNEGNRLIGGIILFSEIISERKKAQEAFIARHDAETANQAKSEFLAVMSHEIRTPMNGILGMAELLLATPLDPRQHHLATTLQSSGQALLALVHDILDFSKIEARKLELETLPFDLPELCQGLLELMQPPATNRGNTLKLSLADSVPKGVRGDPLRLRQVLMNLLSNAIKFTENGQVTLAVNRLETSDNDCTLLFEVRDTGLGMSPETIELLFQPFTQASRDTSRHFGGTGLGLSICRRLVDLMAGSITVDSRPGQGSTFRVTIALPLADPGESLSEALTGIPGTLPQPPIPPGLRLLLVEDEPVNQEVVLGFLKESDISIQVAGDGLAALELLDQNAFDLVLMDWRMPRMDGLTACRTLRERERTRGVSQPLPVIALTAHTTREDREACLQAGMSDTLEKPIRSSHLREKIALWSGRTILQQAPSPTTSAVGTADGHSGSTDSSTGLPGRESPPLSETVAPSSLHKATASVEASGLDPLALTTLEQELRHVPNGLQRIVGKFLDTVPGKLAQMEKGVENGDLTVIFLSAHSLKSQSATVGATRLSELCQKIETQARAGKAEGLAEQVSQANEAFAAARSILEPLRGERERRRG
ncbi:MAG: response regulator [Magnetococcales bacterium]|nr:response regulator [Magnetococcales bacterium]